MELSRAARVEAINKAVDDITSFEAERQKRMAEGLQNLAKFKQ
jgi:hypothetical protein